MPDRDSDAASDPALHLLFKAMQDSPSPRLWVTGEQNQLPAGDVPVDLALTNRVDLADALRTRGVETILNDFDLTALSNVPQTIGLRVAKEKALTHHLINQAAHALPAGGLLWLCGNKQEGIKGYLQRTSRYLGCQPNIQRQAGMQLGEFTRPTTPAGGPLDDQNYASLQALDLDGSLWWTKPGIFGWRSIDSGSALLAAALNQVWPASASPPAQVLDLGCGYGYLAVSAAKRWPQASIVATDNNVAAVTACTTNLSPFGDRATARLADCGAGLQGPFDAILCNPPFHQGFGLQPDLHERFLCRSRELLAPQGHALFVVNQFLALERSAERHFKEIHIVDRTRSFKLVRLSNPKRA